ncbi:hypothetical protein [Bacillus sp. FJAT-49736]|nr:hypothetical protein [Bacillus sp. FJAT-49736]MBS4172632.1 hypothetical protein [Bacillus sp. FJAT-49736]
MIKSVIASVIMLPLLISTNNVSAVSSVTLTPIITQLGSTIIVQITEL